MTDTFYVFDLDGTLANIDHRLHFLEKNDWDGFFAACSEDEPYSDVIKTMNDLATAGARIEIWSGRSAVVETETLNWLDNHCSTTSGIAGSQLIKHMRPEGDYRPDTELKAMWLKNCERRPTMIFDDRQSVVDMWRSNGITCAQVATWKDRKRKTFIPRNPEMTDPQVLILVGPSGAGKSTYVQDFDLANEVVSSDDIRVDLCGDFKDQSRNDDVFKAVDILVEARIRAGLNVVIDATNLHAKNRKGYVSLARSVNPDVSIAYVVIDRPLEEKIRDGAWRNNVIMRDGKTLIENHHDRFYSGLKHILNGDHLGVEVIDMREEL